MEKTVEELQEEVDMLRHKLSPLEDKDFTAKLALGLAGKDLLRYQRSFRGSEHIVVSATDIWCATGWEEEPSARDLTNVGRSLQAMLWERSALHGSTVFVMPLKEYLETQQ